MGLLCRCRFPFSIRFLVSFGKFFVLIGKEFIFVDEEDILLAAYERRLRDEVRDDLKKLDVMRQLQEDWDNGAVQNGFSLEIAQKIWSDAEHFAEYAFNKSHSAAYAILVMRTAYLKAHYPNEFMAAVLTSYMGNTDRMIKYIASCNHNGTPVLPPDINQSNAGFTPVENGILFGLVGVRGVGQNVAEAIIAVGKEFL